MENNATQMIFERTVKYNDLSIRVVLSILAAHIMTAFNEPEHFFEIIFTSSYLRGFIAGLIIAFLITSYIYYVTVRLDKLYNWLDHIFLRFVWQVLLGFAVPAIASFLLVTLFLAIYNINIFNTVYLQRDYPLVLMMLLVINLYYFGLYNFLVNRKPLTSIDKTARIEQPSSITVPEEEASVTSYKETIIITTALKTYPVATDDIAYIFRLNDTVFIRLKDSGDFSESYQTGYSLKDLETFLDPSKFFRINRQMIVNFYAVTAFRSESPKTLLLTLNPPMYTVSKDVPPEYLKLNIVSEAKTPRFKLWMDR